MKVEKTISEAELATILKKHFETAENANLEKFSVTRSISGENTISYETGLVKPTISENLAAELSKAKGVFNSIFSKP